MRKYIAEAIGTAVLVLLGCGSAVFGGTTLSIAFAFGLSVVAMAYTIGGTSGCHINPAITLGVYLSGRMSIKDAVGYWIGQVVGGIVGAAILYWLVGMTGFNMGGANLANAANGVTLGGAFFTEIVATFIFVLVVLGTTDCKVGAGNFAGLAIGLSLVLIHIVCIPLTGTSVNPARSIGPALFVGGEALKQLWVYICAPLIGACLSAVVWGAVSPKE